jgi:hypothetical protein
MMMKMVVVVVVVVIRITRLQAGKSRVWDPMR